MKRLGWIVRGMGVAVLTAALAACSSGGGGSSGSPVVSKGVMTKGSAIVNGVRFEDSAAAISADDTAKTAAFLDDGMVVKVKGTRNADGATGNAELIEVENEVRGPLDGPTAGGTFSVLGQTVVISGATVTAGGVSFNAATSTITGLAQGDFVEVHGMRNAVGEILASRVEKLGADPGEDELRGIVSGVTGTALVLGGAFDINGFAITTNGSTVIEPAGSSIANGTLVEVHLNGSLATQIEVEDAEDVEFEPAEGQEIEVEGIVTVYDSVAGTFEVNGTAVSLTASTIYEGGVLADLADNVLVEVEGHMEGGILIAEKVEFKDSIRIEANADAAGSAGVLDRTVVVTAATEFGGGITAVGQIVQGDGLKIRGFMNLDGVTITATRVEKQNQVASDQIILQGPVSAANESAKTLVIAGIIVDLNSVPAAAIKNDADTVITLAQFYASITLNSTPVKAKGTYSTVTETLTADEVELE